LGIHPFDQPDVQLAKDLARKAMESKGKERARSDDMLSLARKGDLSRRLAALVKKSQPGDYIAIQAYLAPAPGTAAGLERLRIGLRDRLQVATTVGFGPRFLHSTGQLHKGGPGSGVFLQLVDQIAEDLMVPEKDYTFGTLIRAQAEGDYQALKARGRRVLRINLGENAAAGLAQLTTLLNVA
jgi:transaldolase/glucose-6-phosphate isomerase